MVCSCRICSLPEQSFPWWYSYSWHVCVLDPTLTASSPVKYQGHRKIVIASGCCHVAFFNRWACCTQHWACKGCSCLSPSAAPTYSHLWWGQNCWGFLIMQWAHYPSELWHFRGLNGRTGLKAGKAGRMKGTLETLICGESVFAYSWMGRSCSWKMSNLLCSQIHYGGRALRALVPNSKADHLMERRNIQKRHVWPCFEKFSSVEKGVHSVSTLSCWRGNST